MVFNEKFAHTEMTLIIMKKRDIIIIAVFLALAIIGMGAVKLFLPKGNITYVDIYVNEVLYEVAPLNEDTVIVIDQGDGKVNYVEIKDGEVCMSDSTCSEHLCISQGAMSPENYADRPMLNWIICLPNMVTVQLRIEE